MSLHLRNRRIVAGGTAAVLLMAGCVHHGDPKVTMKPFTADLVFGVKPAVEPPPAFAPINPVAAQQQASANIDLVPLPDLGNTFFKPIHGGPSQVTACPDARSTATAPEEAPTNVPDNRLPVAGLYHWKKRGDFSLNVRPTDKFTYGGITRRAVVNPTKVAEPGAAGTGYSLTYQTIQPELSTTNVIITDWRVKTAAQFVQPSAATVNAPNGGDPERGLALEGIQVKDKDGNPVGTPYSFPSGVLYFPLPIRSGTTWQASASDPKSLETLSINGQVVNHERVDACGNLVDGWRVNATLTYSGTDSRTITYSYIVATQYGALIIEEDQSSTDANGTYNPKEMLGQIKPDPLPASSG